jgi:surface polysaccharide O-acyltransferase-like enzyme
MKAQKDRKSGSRLFYLDNLRIYLTILVIIQHAAIAYGGSGDWAVKDPSVDELSPIFLIFFTAVNQTYFMSAFFLLAGYFTPRSLERKGARVFFRDRLIRLGVPILVYSTLIFNLNQVLTGVWLRGQPFQWVFDYQPGHLWFLLALLLFAVIYIFYRVWVDPQKNKQHFQLYSDRFPPDRALIFTIVMLIVLTFVVRIEFPSGKWVFPGFQLAHFVHYAFCFFVGILAYRGDWLARLGLRQVRRWGIVALVIMPLFFVVGILGGALEGSAAFTRFLGGLHWQSLCYTTWESILLIAILTFLLFFFRERFNKTSPLLRSMAASAYTVYIIHQTVLFVFNILFLQVDIPTIVKFPIVSLIAVPLCFGLAALIRRIPYADRVLG